ncbi:MAG TPA: cytochrome c [Blastocatellia bacterium]|nr:cytochrome c [Blastocatellia bacterium]
MSVRVNKRLLFLVLWASLVSAAAIASRPDGGRQSKSKPNSQETAERVKRIFAERCFQCHGLNGKAAKNVFALDRTRLILSGVVIPGDAGSVLLKAVESGAMPLGGPELSVEDKAVVRNWILAGAPDWPDSPDRLDRPDGKAGAASPRVFISESSLLSMIGDDLERIAPRDRQYIRYLSLMHLRNAGTPEEELESHRLAIAKLVNSLSWRREITTPATVDVSRALFRIDLRDYLWTEEMWRRALTDYPYALILPGSERIARLSGEIAAYIRGDWFVAAASTPPLYYELLGAPHSVAELERRLGVDTARHLAEEKNVIRAGVRSSGVSQNNRALERHVSTFGAYWRSYDFRSNLGDQNIFANPLRLNAAGGEIIFNLPNGLQAYFLADAHGRRLDAAPLEIVSDRNQPEDPLIRNGRSCISCHFTGVKSVRDDMRQAIQRQGLSPDDIDRILALYAAQGVIDRALAEDEARFLRAEEKLGGRYARGVFDTNAQTEPVNALSRRFQSELTMVLAAAEAGLEARDFYDRIRWNNRLNGIGLGQLLTPVGAVKRELWERHFGDVASELQLGVHLPGRQLAARWDSTRVNAALFSNATRGRFVQSAPEKSTAGGSTQNEARDLLRAARTVFIRSDTVYLRPELLENVLRGKADFQSLDLAIVRDRQAADLVIDLNRPLFTFDFTYSITHRQSSRLVASGKVTAFDGASAAPKIAKELIREIQSARSQR